MITDKSQIDSLFLANIYSKQNFSFTYNANLNSLYISDCSFDSSFHISSEQDIINEQKDGIICNISGSTNGNLIFEVIPILDLSISAINFGNLTFNKIKVKLIF